MDTRDKMGIGSDACPTRTFCQFRTVVHLVDRASFHIVTKYAICVSIFIGPLVGPFFLIVHFLKFYQVHFTIKCIKDSDVWPFLCCVHTFMLLFMCCKHG